MAWRQGSRSGSPRASLPVTGEAPAGICQNAARNINLGTARMTEGPGKEEKILRMLKRVLTDIAKDTSTPPGMKHPLSENTVQGIRDCLALISARERELSEESGRPSRSRPEFIDEPKKTQVVTLHRKFPGTEEADRVVHKRSKKPGDDKKH
jgi:hypothetical protein